MAKVTYLRDDIDGSPNAKERHFSINDQDYVIDLNERHYAEFLLLFNSYLLKARKVDKKRERNNFAPVLSKEDRSKIRAWAVANGRYIPARGRFPADVVRDYYAGMKAEPKEFIYG